jgi:hypothetical protein
MAPVLAEAGAVRAFIALADGKPKDALGFAIRGVEAARQVGERSPELMQPLLARGESELALKESAAAVKTLEQALALMEETRPWRVYAADARFALARAKAEPDVARKLATEALEIYRASDGQQAKAQAVERFLRQ